MPSPRSTLTLHVVSALTGVGALLAVCGPAAGGAPCEIFETVAHPPPDFEVVPTRFEGIEFLHSDDIWTVGQENETGVALRTMIYHYDGLSWSRVPSPSPGPAFANGTQCWLFAVEGAASDDVWAVGTYNHPTVAGDQPLTLHWDGAEWEHVESLVQAGDGLTGLIISDLTVIASDDIWLAGIDADHRGPMVHYDGSSWEIIRTPDPVANGACGMLGVDGLASDDVWAVGGVGTLGPPSSGGFASHWDGSEWTNYEFDPGGIPYILFAVEMIATDDVWAAGTWRDDENVTHPFFVHWDGAAWTQFESPGFATSLVGFGPDDVWGVSGGQLVHYDGSSWTLASALPITGAGLNSLDGASACELWSAGLQTPGASVHTTLIAHQHGEVLTGDLDDDGDVDLVDLLALLAAWGPCQGCPADLDGDGIVGTADLLPLLANWG